ncbi:hypothetical protein DFJ77DRAFT_134931 [Powellomyces hirtus]|nr:hypothetical protein DFJ77DRAFT_134931 [Powellomyces hirtus]
MTSLLGHPRQRSLHGTLCRILSGDESESDDGSIDAAFHHYKRLKFCDGAWMSGAERAVAALARRKEAVRMEVAVSVCEETSEDDVEAVVASVQQRQVQKRQQEGLQRMQVAVSVGSDTSEDDVEAVVGPVQQQQQEWLQRMQIRVGEDTSEDDMEAVTEPLQEQQVMVSVCDDNSDDDVEAVIEPLQQQHQQQEHRTEPVMEETDGGDKMQEECGNVMVEHEEHGAGNNTLPKPILIDDSDEDTAAVYTNLHTLLTTKSIDAIDIHSDEERERDVASVDCSDTDDSESYFPNPDFIQQDAVTPPAPTTPQEITESMVLAAPAIPETEQSKPAGSMDVTPITPHAHSERERGLRLFQLADDTASVSITPRSTTNPTPEAWVSPSPPPPELRAPPVPLYDFTIPASERVKLQKRKAAETPRVPFTIEKCVHKSHRKKSAKSSKPSEDDGIYEVDTILNVRRAHAPTSTFIPPRSWPFLTEHTPVDKEYLIAWKHYPDEADNTWEPEANVEDAYLRLKEFWARRRLARRSWGVVAWAARAARAFKRNRGGRNRRLRTSPARKHIVR